MILRDYARLDRVGGESGLPHHTHFRSAGEGPPLLALHPSPLSSAFMLPLMEQISDVVQVIAPDTPGYGMSDPLPGQAESLEPYVEWLAAFVRNQGFQSVGLYGSATGAQIAVEFARRYPEQTRYAVLDNAVHFHEEERREILARYFPDMAPQADGSHLQKAWEMASALFTQFPWYDTSDAARVDAPQPPLPVVHATALACLNSGEDYARAYRAAFMNEDAQRILSITCPVRVIRWAGSVLKKYADRLDGFDWPEHIKMVHCEATPPQRFAAIRQVVVELSA